MPRFFLSFASVLFAAIFFACREKPALPDNSGFLEQKQPEAAAQVPLVNPTKVPTPRTTSPSQDQQARVEEIPADLPDKEQFALTQKIYDAFKEKLAAEGTISAEKMAAYEEKLMVKESSGFKLVPIRGGDFLLGSPADEPGHKSEEGPQVQVKISPFWMAECEIAWDTYRAFMDNGKQRNRDGSLVVAEPGVQTWDAVTQPTPPSYMPMNLGMGNGYESGFPSIAMSQHAASQFCKWLSAQTGHYYRLPTEAEWEFACRAGTTSAYYFGKDGATLATHAWFFDNANDQYQRVGKKSPNQWGLFDMHGNVAEWVIDQFDPNFYASLKPGTLDPLNFPQKQYPRVVRGGSWDDSPAELRSASRRPSSPDWNAHDPQNPQSMWYLTEGKMIGFRVVRPLNLPSATTVHKLWHSAVEQKK